MGIFDFFKKKKTVTQAYHIGAAEIEANESDPQRIIDPVWWSVSIYDGEKKYNDDLKPFSPAQRYVFAIQWYVAEVNNGGHDQFFFNSTGIVWRDALTGLREIGHERAAGILQGAADRLGGNPPMDRMERQELLEKWKADFEELDTAFYEISDLDATIMRYVKDHARDFYFDGTVKRLPQ